MRVNNDENILYSPIGKFIANNYKINCNYDYISISPKAINLIKSNEGLGVVISKEFLGESFIYKISIEGVNVRVNVDLNNNIDLGDKCNISLKKNHSYYLFPGGLKNII